MQKDEMLTTDLGRAAEPGTQNQNPEPRTLNPEP
jgi:hypothetical protein